MKRMILFVSLALMLIPASLMGQAKHQDYNLPEVPNRAKYIDFPSLDRGLWFATQLTPGYNMTQGFFAQADLIAGYRFGEFIKVGAGLSPRYGAAGFALPIYLDARGNIISQESRMAVPYWNLDAGYTIKQGLYLSPTIGVRVGEPRNNFLAGATYILQQLGPGVFSHAIGIRLGYEF
ncbi:MAG: hypothetical protein J6O51_10710 [Bacteroidales bacterium]|nr:hypothetical protein [Bacteroidales bacterium]